MFGRFLPRETSFFDFFEQHAALTIEGTKEFLSLVTTGANIAAKCRRISDIEHETDTITHRCVEALHKTFITPIDRDSIHRLITRMDDIMDFVEAAAERIELYELTVMTADVRDLADVLHRSALQVEQAIRGPAHAQGSAGDAQAVHRHQPPRERGRRDPAPLGRPPVQGGEGSDHRSSSGKRSTRTSRTPSDRCEDVANIIEGVILEHAVTPWTSTTIVIVTIAAALLFDVINGFHDAANSIATVVSTRVLSPRVAVLWAAIVQLHRAVHLPSGRRRHDLEDRSTSRATEPAYVWVVICGLVGAIAWNLLTWWWGLPSSSSHALIGGLSGAGIAFGGHRTRCSSATIAKTLYFIPLAPLIGLVARQRC